MQQSKRKVIKTRAGELGHLDCRCLGKDQIVGSKSRRCLVAMLDARARLAWAEAADDLKSLSVMFAALKSLNLLNAEYGIRFEAVLTDNGAEAASRGNLAGHPMERLLGELALYLLYSDTARPHQGLGGKTPLHALQDLSTNYLTSTGMTGRRRG